MRQLYSGYFALVMATGIVSEACRMLGHERLSDALLVINFIAYLVLCAATIGRAILYRPELWRDLTDPRLVFSFFTIVAASNVLGVELLYRGHERIATALWLIALVVWGLLSYFSFALLIFTNHRRGADVVHGGWLIAIVGTESLVLLGTMLAPSFGELAGITFVAMYALWGIGVALYGIFVTLFSNRIFFFRVAPSEVMPLFWVVMGAAAIASNAGCALLMCAPPVPFLIAQRPFVQAMTLILWAWATWWIPLLVIVGIWKHGVNRVPITYHPMYWSLVFPLGMYSAVSHRLSLVADLAPLGTIAHTMMWVALSAWTIAMVGWAGSAVRSLRVGSLAPS